MVVRTDAGWSEHTVTWNTRPDLVGDALDTLGAIAAGALVELDVTSAIEGDGTYAFALRPTSGDGASFVSREGGTAPVLIVTESGGCTRTTCDAEGAECGAIPDGCGGTLVRRKDDEPDAIRNRLRVYREQTAPILAWYERAGARIAHLDAAGTMDEVFTRAMKAVGR